MNQSLNVFAEAEQMLFNGIWSAAGKQTAQYRYGDTEVTLHVIPQTPQPDGFAFEEFTLYKTGRVFIIGRQELNGHLPKEGDTFTHDDVVYIVKRTASGPCYEEQGNYNTMLKLHVSVNR